MIREYWNRFLGWRGWRIIFPLPLWAEIFLFLAAMAALIWVFWNGLEQWWPAYFLYGFSAYLLTALCVRIPAAVQMGRRWFREHPQITGVLENKELLFSVKLSIKQIINFSYGIYKIVTGVVIGSAWIGADGIYNLVQAVIQLFQLLRRKNPGSIRRQWGSYRACGILVLLMHFTLIGIVFQMVNWNRVKESGEILIIATAAFAFYKLITAIIALVKDRKHSRPIDSSVRMLELTQAIFAIFSLQAGLLHIFGTGEAWEHWMNLAVGCAVCMLTVAIGIYMIRRGNREIKQLQENRHG